MDVIEDQGREQIPEDDLLIKVSFALKVGDINRFKYYAITSTRIWEENGCLSHGR